jgi:hypothetical protein
MDLYGDMKKALAGAKFGLHDETETFTAGENIYPGDPCFGMVGEKKVCFGAHVNAVALTASEALVAGNQITVTINGITLDPVAFINSSPDTMRAIVQAIDLNDQVRALGIDAFLVEGNPLAFYLSAPGVSITASASVTGGASQATFNQTAYTDAKFVGVARHEELSYREGTGFYPATTSVSVMTYGKVWVPVADDATPDDKKPAYVILSGPDAGKFTDVASSNYDTGAFFRSERTDGSLALVELRGMK